MIARTDIERTATRIGRHIRRTPVIDITLPQVNRPVALKLELFQHTASFKARGAFANLAGRQIPAPGIAAASGGNHGAAAAYAAREFGVPARIFVPMLASPAKVARIRSYGATIDQDGPTYYEALDKCMSYVAQSGALNVHAYDEEPTLLGQGTIGLEIEEQVPDLDTLLVAVGGGGLIGGIAAWFHGKVKIVAVEPETCNSLHAAMAAGEPVRVTPSGIAADSLGASLAGKLMFPIAKAYVDSVALVSDAEIRNAQRYLWESLRLVTEPGGATAIAALLSGSYRPSDGERVGVLICGGNTEPETFAKVIAGEA
ncbi:MAG: threonine/serine dehydratase [Hyphomicrobiales bacterium]